MHAGAPAEPVTGVQAHLGPSSVWTEVCVCVCVCVYFGLPRLFEEARVYNGLKTISLKSDAGKTGQPLVKE